VLYVSHAPDEVARLADHIVVMEAGRAVANGPLTDTLARLDLPIQLGEDVGVVLDAVVAERDAAMAPGPRRVPRRQPVGTRWRACYWRTGARAHPGARRQHRDATG
jgi:energy-coupling factor transporter ATP-binding protein EcfA2